MLSGGGTVVMAGHDNVVAPGGESVVHDDYFGSHDLLVYHYLDKRLMSVNVPATPTSEAHPLGTMTPMLGINFLDFSSGFPVAY
jgi:arabinan endo-1,5-alpha-L-arabinosidase